MDLLLVEESTWSSVGMEHVSGESIHSFLESAGQKKLFTRRIAKNTSLLGQKSQLHVCVRAPLVLSPGSQHTVNL